MVIESEQGAIQDLELVFQGLRQRVVITRFSSQLQDYIKSSNPDISLVAISMKDRKELEFVLEIKEDAITKAIPIVAVIQNENDSFLQNYKQLGFMDYLKKPYERYTLLKKIESILNQTKRKGNDKIDELGNYVTINKTLGRTNIVFRGSTKKNIVQEIRKVITPLFLKSIVKDLIIIDIRQVYDFEEDEIKIFEKILTIFDRLNVAVIAGRHLGDIVSETEIQEKIHVFMSQKELEDFYKLEATQADSRKAKEAQSQQQQ